MQCVLKHCRAHKHNIYTCTCSKTILEHPSWGVKNKMIFQTFIKFKMSFEESESRIIDYGFLTKNGPDKKSKLDDISFSQGVEKLIKCYCVEACGRCGHSTAF